MMSNKKGIEETEVLYWQDAVLPMTSFGGMASKPTGHYIRVGNYVEKKKI